MIEPDIKTSILIDFLENMGVTISIPNQDDPYVMKCICPRRQRHCYIFTEDATIPKSVASGYLDDLGLGFYATYLMPIGLSVN
jgi:hypothetical protein